VDETDKVCSVYEKRRNAYKILVGKPGRPRHRWKNNIKMRLKM
jgi:hypothetical protein